MKRSDDADHDGNMPTVRPVAHVHTSGLRTKGGAEVADVIAHKIESQRRRYDDKEALARRMHYEKWGYDGVPADSPVMPPRVDKQPEA